MELVYLWVEDYKNIKKQGFNFSPRFKCHYDETIKKHTIDENKDYVSIFPENINVTAIVGGNGSGKSSVLKLIRQIIDRQVTDGQVTDGSFLIFYDKTKDKCIVTKDDEVSSSVKFPLFDYSLTYDSSINFQNKQLPVYPIKDKGLLSFNEELATNQKNIIQNHHTLKDKNKLNKFKDFFQLDTIKVIFYLEKLKDYKEELIESEVENFQNLIDKFNKDISVKRFLTLIKEIFDFLSKNKYFKDKQMYIEKLSELLKDMGLNKEEHFKFIYGDNDLLSQALFSLEQKNHNSYADGYLGNNIWEIETYEELFLTINKLESIMEEEKNVYCLFSFDVNKLSKNQIDILLDSFPLEYFKLELIDTNRKKLSDLSFGEQQLIFILNQIYSLGMEADEDLYDEISPEDLIEQGFNLSDIPRFYKLNYVILFDEIDIGFHPDWQKRTIQYIIDFLNSTDDEKYYHLIFTSHSPFLLSDLPKENVIFLEKYEDKDNEVKNGNQKVGNCKNVSDETNIDTFGANIHNLLSHGFFMKDGLMGEFAKGKINEIIKNLNNQNYKPEEKERIKVLRTIQIIGEPFLKQKLLDMYYKKFDKEARKKELEKEKARIEEELKKYD
jgi:ABC-type dipeptide/oligopeptide/nickel transport system ATPase component